MHVACRLVLINAFLAAPALAQDNPNQNQLKKMYDDALAQLKSVQDRRNELARENEGLNEKVKALDAQVAALRNELEASRKSATIAAEKTFYMRAHYAAWQGFLQRYPDLLVKWRSYLGTALMLPTSEPDDAAWPFDAAG